MVQCGAPSTHRWGTGHPCQRSWAGAGVSSSWWGWWISPEWFHAYPSDLRSQALRSFDLQQHQEATADPAAPVLYHHFPLFSAVNEGHPPFSDTPNYPIVKTKVPWFSMFLETFWGSMPGGSRLKSWDRTWIPTAVHFRSFVLKAATSGPSTSQTVGLGFSSFLPDPTKRSPETNEIPRTAWGHQTKSQPDPFFSMILMWMKKTNKAHIRSLGPLASYPGATCFPPHLKHLPK